MVRRGIKSRSGNALYISKNQSGLQVGPAYSHHIYKGHVVGYYIQRYRYYSINSYTIQGIIKPPGNSSYVFGEQLTIHEKM